MAEALAVDEEFDDIDGATDGYLRQIWAGHLIAPDSLYAEPPPVPEPAIRRQYRVPSLAGQHLYSIRQARRSWEERLHYRRLQWRMQRTARRLQMDREIEFSKRAEHKKRRAREENTIRQHHPAVAPVYQNPDQACLIIQSTWQAQVREQEARREREEYAAMLIKKETLSMNEMMWLAGFK